MIHEHINRASAKRQEGADPVAIILEGFVRDLRSRGHTPRMVGRYAAAAKHFGTWVRRRIVGANRISREHIQEFLCHHLRRCHCPKPHSRALQVCRPAMGRLVDFMQRRKLLSPPKRRSGRLATKDKLLAAFDCHLDRVCGLAASTRAARQRVARDFLKWWFGKGRSSFGTLRPRDLIRFVNHRARTLKTAGIRDVADGLRGFLRFLEFTDQVSGPLWRAVPKLAAAPSSQPPKILSPSQMNRFLKCFDRRSASGQRNFAIALCLSELGLRCAEVAALELEDLDWRAMTLRLRRTKQRRERLLPLPSKVAQAIAGYLKAGRPLSKTRALFVRHRAPLGEPLKPHHVRSAIRLAFGRCGIDAAGTHILRHTWATRAHRSGASLKMIADILGHQSLNTTNRYAHLNIEELRQVALPWPGCRAKP